MERYTVPSEVVSFVNAQLTRFNILLPQWEAVEHGAKHVIHYVAKHRFFPNTPEEAAHRYAKPGLTFPEKVQLLGPVELITRGKFNVELLHVIAWAALLWCWSEEGLSYLAWYSETQVENRRYTPDPVAQFQMAAPRL